VSAVAAVVHDKVITTFDVDQRIRLMLLSGGQINSPQALAQFQVRALRDLVEEKLKLMEAAKFKVQIPPEEVQAEIADMAAGAGLTVPMLRHILREQNIEFETLEQQLQATIVWPQIISGRFRNRVRVSDEEVEQTLVRMREDASLEQFLVSEICIPVPQPNVAQQYYEGSLQLIEQMRRGVPFSVVAQQFSACTSAAAGGDLGWVRAGELPAELDSVIKILTPGTVSNPIPSDGAFIIMALRDKREAVVQGEQTFTLVYAGTPMSAGRNQAIANLERLKNADICGRSGTRQDLGPDIGMAMMENVKLDAIDPRFRNAVDGLNRGELSPPVEADGYMHAAYVCEKDDGLGLPTRDTIKDRIYSRQLNRISQQYLRDLERAVHVDIRMRPPTAAQSG